MLNEGGAPRVRAMESVFDTVDAVVQQAAGGHKDHHHVDEDGTLDIDAALMSFAASEEMLQLCASGDFITGEYLYCNTYTAAPVDLPPPLENIKNLPAHHLLKHCRRFTFLLEV